MEQQAHGYFEHARARVDPAMNSRAQAFAIDPATSASPFWKKETPCVI
jgi:hypothetical protein